MPGKNPRKEDSAARWNLKDIRDILDLLAEQGISEFELENNGFRVRVKRGGSIPVQAAVGSAAEIPHFGIVHPVESASNSGSEGTRTAAAAAATQTVDQQDGLHIIKSPIVGTFYEAAGPNSEPFVKAGDVVRQGQVLCIIEAMKLMNEIESEIDGEIARTFAKNGQPVEYGQALFGLIPSARK